jgi:hypothetical protein
MDTVTDRIPTDHHPAAACGTVTPGYLLASSCTMGGLFLCREAADQTLGRPRISEKVEKRIQEQLRAGKGINKVAREVGVGTGTVQRIAQEMPRPFVAVA